MSSIVRLKHRTQYSESGQRLRETSQALVELVAQVPAAPDTGQIAMGEDAPRYGVDFRQMVEASPDAVLLLEYETCVYANPGAATLFGAHTVDDLLDHPVLGMIYTDDLSARPDYQAELLHHDGPLQLEHRLLRLDGTEIDIEVSVSGATYQGRPAILWIARDITEVKSAAEYTRYLADIDPFTNLPNKRTFLFQAAELLDGARHARKRMVFVAVSVNKMHLINSVYGAAVGEILLDQIVARLEAALREGELLTHPNCTNFYLLLRCGKAGDCEARIAQLQHALAAPFDAQGEEMSLSFTLGTTAFPDTADDIETLEQHAVLAMHLANKQGVSCNAFTREIGDAIARRQLIETHLRRALERNDELLAFYQPQVRLTDCTLHGMETLARWQHPEWGMISPGEFIPVAEETGLINQLDEYIMRQACIQMKQWADAGHGTQHVSCNLSARDFYRPNLVPTVRSILADTALNPEQLRVEITESAVMDNFDHALKTLTQLRDLGLQLEIDDFGTGHSSLNYLARFPVQTVKIDQSFTRNMTANPRDAAVISAISALSHALDLTVLVEGVETPAQLRCMQDIGCDVVQGYFFGRPVCATDFTRQFLANPRCFADQMTNAV